jgi:hypothetical protein
MTFRTLAGALLASDADYARYRALIEKMGYDMAQLRRIPQRWPEAEPALW